METLVNVLYYIAVIHQSFVVVTGFSCSRIQFFSLSRQGSRESHLPTRVRVRSFSETAVCYGSKDGTTKDSGSDGGKVKFLESKSYL